jgi:hypothetical protein
MTPARLRRLRRITESNACHAASSGASKKAIIAVAASILTSVYHMLKDGTMYQDLGADHFNRRSTDRQKTRLVKRLADLGYAVELKPLAA